jgi:hypothetical protein
MSSRKQEFTQQWVTLGGSPSFVAKGALGTRQLPFASFALRAVKMIAPGILFLRVVRLSGCEGEY